MLLPVFIVLLCDQLRVFLNSVPRDTKEKYSLLAFLFLVHVGFAIFLSKEGNVIISSYGVVALSFIFFSLRLTGRLQNKSLIFPLSLLILVALQPCEVYHHLSKNVRVHNFLYQYDKPYFYTSLTRADKEWAIKEKNLEKGKDVASSIPVVYFAVDWLNFLMQNLNYEIFEAYVRHKFIVYDDWEWVRNEDLDIKKVERTFAENKNTAFVSFGDSQQPGIRPVNVQPSALHAQRITRNSEQFQLLAFNANALKVKTHFLKEKFLVYNDSFYKGWHAFVNGKEIPIFRANVAFKGIWLPPGENTIDFRFRQKGTYLLNFLFIGIFDAAFLYLLWLWRKASAA